MSTLIASEENLEEFDLRTPFVKLHKDVRKAAVSLGRREVTWLINSYYSMQELRIRTAHQIRKADEFQNPHELNSWVNMSMQRFESAIKSAMKVFSETYQVGNWMMAQCGIAEVLSAALLAHFDIRKAPTVGHMWRFAGLDPSLQWNKGEKRPYNAQLKAICAFRMGECFVRTSGNEKSFYGKLYAEKKLTLEDQNENGFFREQAEVILKSGKFKKETGAKKAYEQGRLPQAQIHNRARRWAVKLFLSHLHHVMHVDYFGKDPPAPYIFEHPANGKHVHLVKPPLYVGYTYGGKGLKKMMD